MKIVLSTVSEAEAGELAHQLVSERLAACCNKLPAVESTYWWEGRVTTDLETLLVFKVADDRVDALMERLEALHPYELPEIVVLSVETALDAYMAWVNREGRPLPTT